MGVKVAVNIWNPAMQETEHQTELAIYDLLHQQNRQVDGWREIYDKVILDTRKQVANALDEEVAKQLAKLS